MAIYLGSQSSGGNITVNDDHIFTTTGERDTYFSNNPSELNPDIYSVVSGQLYQYRNSVWVDISTVIQGPRGPSGTDVTLYGVDNLGTAELVTINVDTTKFDVAPFNYYIGGVNYSFGGQTGISSGFVLGDDFIIIGANSSGVFLHTKNTFLQPQDLETSIELGGIATTDGSNIAVIGNSYPDYTEFYQDIFTWSKFAKQTNFIGVAGSVSESATPLQLDIAAGDIIDPDLHLEQIPAGVDVGMVAYHNVTGQYELQPLVTPFVVDTLQYDNGTDLATLGNNKWASHTIARSSRTGTYYFIYSEAQYDNEASAVDAPFSLGGFSGQAGAQVEPLAKIVIQKSTPGINDVIDIRNNTTNVVSASTSTMQTTYDRSSTPQVVLSSGNPIEKRNNVGDTNTTLETWSSNDGVVKHVEVTKEGLTTGDGTALPNRTNDHTLEVKGFPLHKVGWRDLVAKFSVAAAGGQAPTVADIGNGHRLRRFSEGDSMFIEYHVDHDYAQGTDAYFHVHWFPTTTMSIGETVVWTISYTIARGHQQGEAIDGTRTVINLVHTADGTEVAGEHMVTEAADIDAFDLLEPDAQILAEITRGDGTYASNVFGIQADLHYQSDREVTIGKRPDFNVAD